MDAQQLFLLRYKKGLAQPQTGFLLATSLARAEMVGRAYCSDTPGCRYIHVAPAIIADETILKPDASAARKTA